MIVIIARLLLFVSLFLCAGGNAFADMPFLYSRDTLTILRRADASLPWQPGQESNVESLPFEVEVKNAESYYQQRDWFNLSELSPESGVLLVFEAPTLSPITPSQQYEAVDILFVDPLGQIRQIVPQINLAQLSQDIMPSDTVLAFLFLKGGTCEQKGIKPGDSVEYKLFKKPPTVLSQPSEQTPQVEADQPVIIMQDKPRPRPLVRTASGTTMSLDVYKRTSSATATPSTTVFKAAVKEVEKKK